MEKRDKMKKIKEYQIWLVIGVLILFMAFIEKRVRIFYILGTIVFIIGLVFWILEDKKSINKKNIKGRQK